MNSGTWTRTQTRTRTRTQTYKRYEHEPPVCMHITIRSTHDHSSTLMNMSTTRHDDAHDAWQHTARTDAPYKRRQSTCTHITTRAQTRTLHFFATLKRQPLRSLQFSGFGVILEL